MTDQPFVPLLHTQSDVEALWRKLMTPLGFGSCSLWMITIQDDRPIPALLEIARTELEPEEGDAEALAGVLRHLAGPCHRFAFLRSRPGSGRPDLTDVAWARAVAHAGRLAGARLEVVHLAHDRDVYPLPLDDLLAEPA
jgi:hypothetical protein